MQVTLYDSLFKCALLIWRAAQTKRSQSESARSLLTLYLHTTKKDSMSVTRGAFRDLQQNKENNPAGAEGSRQQHAAPKPANSSAKSKRDLFPINESDEEASQQEMQEKAPKKRLQQFTTDPDWELSDNEKVLTSDALRTPALDAFPDLR